MNERIRAALRDVERQFEVRILLAVESGSRAWGFASPDSDYDVRFVYAHPRDWYLSVGDARDVIEQMLPGDLDVSGWELRKALRLFSKCNLALNEWLGSPVTYQEIAEFRRELLRPSESNQRLQRALRRSLWRGRWHRSSQRRRNGTSPRQYRRRNRSHLRIDRPTLTIPITSPRLRVFLPIRP